MILYEDKNDKIGIYEFAPKDKYEIFKYKTDELGKISEEDKVYYAESKVGYYSSPIFSDDMFKIKNGVYESSEVDCDDEALERRRLLSNPYYNRLLISKRNHGNMALIEKYIHGAYDSKKIAKIIYQNDMKYFLLTDEYKSLDSDISSDQRLYIMRNIIQLPESLYKLQLLQNGFFDNLESDEIKEQLDLFSLKELDSIDKETIRKMDLYKIGKQSYYETMLKVESDSKKLKLLKK